MRRQPRSSKRTTSQLPLSSVLCVVVSVATVFIVFAAASVVKDADPLRSRPMTLASLHASAPPALVQASGRSDAMVFLEQHRVPERLRPVVNCKSTYVEGQFVQLLAECLPYAERGLLTMLEPADVTAEEAKDDLALATSLSVLHFLVVLHVHAKTWPGAAPFTAGSYNRIAPGVFLRVLANNDVTVLGSHSPTDSFMPSPVVVMGNPLTGSDSADFAAMANAGSTVLLVARPREGPNQQQRLLDFVSFSLCAGGIRAVLTADRGTADGVVDINDGCGAPVVLAGSVSSHFSAAESMAAHVARVVSVPDGWLQQAAVRGGAATVLRGDGQAGILRLSVPAVIPVLRPQCLPMHGLILHTFLIRCLPGKRGLYVQATTIPWDIMLYQRPQHITAAMAKRNLLVLFQQYMRVVGGIMQSPFTDSVFLCDTDFPLPKVQGAVVNVHSTMQAWEPSVLVTLASQGNEIIYEYIDAIDGQISGPGAVTKLRKLRETALAHATLLVYTASALRKDLEDGGADEKRLVLVPNAVAPEQYETSDGDPIPHKVQALLKKHEPIVGYFGAIAPWIDVELVHEVAAKLPAVQFVMIGPAYWPTVIPDPATIPPNIHYIGPVHPKRLILHARHWSAAIIPFAKGEIARTTSPLKLFEYFAVGLPVVVTDDMLECLAFPEVLAAGDAATFAAKVEEAIRQGSDPQHRQRLKDLAHENSWDARAQTTLAALARVAA